MNNIFYFAFCLALLPSLSLASGLESQRTVVSGQLKSSASCSRNDFQVFLAQERQLLHQIMVPPNGTFSIDVVPGRYGLFVKNPDKCSTDKEIKISSGEKLKLVLSPENYARMPAAELSPGCYCIQAQGCPCNGGGGGGGGIFRPPSYIQPMWNPWWIYQAPFYSNFYYPGPWMNYGLNGGYYPGSGHIGLAKPNVYIRGPQGTQIELKVNRHDPKSTWLATVPSYEAKGWVGRLTKENKIEVAKVNYPYLYYDLRTHEETFQNSQGFCANRNEAIQKMSTILGATGFAKNEIKDFEEHWQIKMPPRDVCVYPQGEKELSALAELDVKPEPTELRRMVFVVVYKDKKQSKYQGKFLNPPTQLYKLSPGAKRVPAAAEEKAIIVNEWGVAFLFEN